MIFYWKRFFLFFFCFISNRLTNKYKNKLKNNNKTYYCVTGPHNFVTPSRLSERNLGSPKQRQKNLLNLFNALKLIEMKYDQVFSTKPRQLLVESKIMSCIRIRTREGIYHLIYPFAWRRFRGQSPRELLKAMGYILPYIMSRVLLRTVYHFNNH